MKKIEMNSETCHVGHALKVIGGKWSLRIVNEIGLESKRFGELKRLLPSISEKMLIQELKSLVNAKIIDRKSYNQVPPKVEYSLTDLGKNVLPIIVQMKMFGQKLIDHQAVDQT